MVPFMASDTPWFSYLLATSPGSIPGRRLDKQGCHQPPYGPGKSGTCELTGNKCFYQFHGLLRLWPWFKGKSMGHVLEQ